MRSSNSLLVIILVVAGGYVAWKYVIEPSTKTIQTGETVQDGEGRKSAKGPSVYGLKDKLKNADSAIWRFENHICLFCKRQEGRRKVLEEIELAKERIRALDLPNPDSEQVSSSKYDFYRKWRTKTVKRIEKIGEMTWRYYKVQLRGSNVMGTSRTCSR